MKPNPMANPSDHLLAIENQLVMAAKHFRLELKRSPFTMKAHLAKLGERHLAEIGVHLESVLKTFHICSSENIDPWDDREFFRLSMRTMGLTFPKDFTDHIRTSDLIEGYNMNRLQIFRNMRFMEISGYSLLEILSMEWTVLYDRPRAITERMISLCDNVLWEANRTIVFDVPAHYIRELRSIDRNVYEIKFKHLTPLFIGPNQPFGMLGTSSIEFIGRETNSDNLSFI